MNSPVPLVTSDAAVYPIEDGEYEINERESKERLNSWIVSQSGVQISRAQRRYNVRVLPNAKTFLKKETKGSRAASESAGFLLLTIWRGKPLFTEHKNSGGFALGGLDNGYFVMQMPGSDDPNAFSKDAENPPLWMVLPVRKLANGFEIAMLEEKVAERASIGLLGSKQECDSEGKCKDVPLVKGFTKSPETNRAILKAAISESAPQGVVSLVRVR